MLKLMMVTTELLPYAKTGGLADMVTALSRALGKENVDIRIIMPRYYNIDREILKKHPYPLGVPVPYGYGEEWIGLFEGVLPGTDIPVYFIDHEEAFGRDGVYSHPGEEGFKDNAKRFSLFNKAVFQVCRALEWIPDVFHCHDWSSSLVPYFLKKEEQYREFSSSSSMLTIHNLGYQGVFSLDDVMYIQHERDLHSVSTLEYSGALNFLKAGIMSADLITTVSPTYAEEIKTHRYGYGLDGILRYRQNDFSGILNGVDYDHWDPENDPYLKPDNYTASKTASKAKVKKRLQKEMGLNTDSTVPVIGMVTRLAEQKGISELFAPGTGSISSILSDFNVQVVILGSGEKWCEDEISRLASAFPNLSVWIGYNDRLAHLIEGGSDFFLMPSRYEPCGLNQLYSLKYGSIPIVRHTGGLADTVENYNQNTGEGTGFVFNDLNPHVLYNVAGWAVSTWYDRRKDITKLRKRGMAADFSWKKSSDKYLELYKKIGN
jgi:starch synthase